MLLHVALNNSWNIYADIWDVQRKPTLKTYSMGHWCRFATRIKQVNILKRNQVTPNILYNLVNFWRDVKNMVTLWGGSPCQQKIIGVMVTQPLPKKIHLNLNKVMLVDIDWNHPVEVIHIIQEKYTPSIHISIPWWEILMVVLWNLMKSNTYIAPSGQRKSFSMYGCIAQKKKGWVKPEAWKTSSGLSPFFRGQFVVASKMALKSNRPQGLPFLLPREKLSFCYVYQRGIQICQQKRHQVRPMKNGSSRVCVECIATTGSRRALVGWLKLDVIWI